MRRGHHSTSSSSAFDQPSSSHLNDDDDYGNGEGTSRASTPSPIRYVNSLTDQVPQVFQNPPNIEPHLEPFYTRQTEIINRQVQLRDENRGGVRSIGKSLRRLWRNMKKIEEGVLTREWVLCSKEAGKRVGIGWGDTECKFKVLARLAPLGYMSTCNHGPCVYNLSGDLAISVPKGYIAFCMNRPWVYKL
ncbi:hypothetical protein Tco_0139302 [Tanacetum coccineum]